MQRSPFSRCAEPFRSCAHAAALALFLVSLAAPRVDAQSESQSALLERAAKAESAFQFDRAAADLYQLLIEQPRSADVSAARLRLARLLALSGDLPAAILQCQALRDSLPAEHPLRATAFDLATLLSRRLRTAGAPSAFSGNTMTAARGVTALDQPIAVDFHPLGNYLVVDDGSGKTFRVAAEAATPVASTEKIGAATFLPDGTVVSATRLGVTIGAGKPVFFTGTFGGKSNQLKKIRSMAALSSGDLLVVDRDFDVLFRCKAGGTSCAVFGPPGKLRAVKAGAGDFVFLLADSQQSVRVLDPNGKAVGSIGPMLGTLKLNEIVDIGVDGGYGVYLLEKETRRVYVAVLRSAAPGAGAGPLSIVQAGSAAVPAEGANAIRNPSAIGVAPDGSVLVAGQSSARLLRLQ